MDEQVDILLPPLFTHTGETLTRRAAYHQGKWIGTFNLWIVTSQPEPGIIYQQRSPQSTWAPNMLDVTAGGHYQTGETLLDGMREVEEELGKRYAPEATQHLGRKLYVGFNNDGTSHNNIIDIYLAEDNEPLSSFTLDPSEVYAICVCPVRELLAVHRDPTHRFTTMALTATGARKKITVSQDSFPENWDPYHYKIAILADRYFNGETDLLY